MHTGKNDQVHFLETTLDIYFYFNDNIIPSYRFKVSELMSVKPNVAPKSNLSKNVPDAARNIEYLES